jgi:hypothetical protein
VVSKSTTTGHLIYKCGGIDKRTIEKFEKASDTPPHAVAASVSSSTCAGLVDSLISVVHASFLLHGLSVIFPTSVGSC